MSLNDWILALHLLSAFALVGSMIVFWVVYLALRSADPLSAVGLSRLARIANAVIGVGIGGTFVFGVWLSISKDPYHVWDGWVIGALVLWAIGTETGRRAGTGVARGGTALGERTLLLHGVSSLAVLLILVDMIWKPGA